MIIEALEKSNKLIFCVLGSNSNVVEAVKYKSEARHDGKVIVGPKQRDKKARLFFNIWSFTTVKSCPKHYSNAQNRFKFL